MSYTKTKLKKGFKQNHNNKQSQKPNKRHFLFLEGKSCVYIHQESFLNFPLQSWRAHPFSNPSTKVKKKKENETNGKVNENKETIKSHSVLI